MDAPGSSKAAIGPSGMLPRIQIPPKPIPDPFLLRILPGIVLFSIIVFGIAVNSHLRHGQDKNICKMTYMYPNYVKLDGPSLSATRTSAKYSLWLYKEGQQVDEHVKLDGYPVIFIPGNAGSSRQVRSIASVAHNQHRDSSNRTRKLDFFAVETNEEMSAFSGRLILEQAEYVNAAIPYVLSLYPRNSRLQVSVLAHSMGGVVARTVFTLPAYRRGTIDVIYTLAAPHQNPPVALDWKLTQVYDHVNEYWRNGTRMERYGNHTIANVAVISIAGGNHDEMVSSGLTELDALVPPSRGLTVYSTGIPNVWTPCDHRQILWCNQLVKAIATSLAMICGRKEWTANQKVDQLRPHLTSGFMWTPGEYPLEKPPYVEFPSNLIEELVSVESAFRKPAPSTTRTIKFFPIPQHFRVELEIIAVKKTADGKPPFMNIYSCSHPVKGNSTKAECLGVNHIHWVPLPLASSSKGADYDLRVWHATVLNPLFGFNNYLALDVLGGGEIFSAEYSSGKLGEPFDASLLDLVKGVSKTFASYRIINAIHVSAITSDLLKYKVSYNSSCERTPSFWPILHGSSPPSSDEKFLSSKTPSSFSFYASPNNPGPHVLFKIITDKACEYGNTTIHLKLDLYASAGRLVERVGIAWIVFPVGMGIACLGYFGWQKQDPSFPRAFVDHMLSMPSPVVTLFGTAVFQSRFDSFALAVIPQRHFYTATGHALKTATKNLMLGISDIYLPPIIPALYIFSGCLALVVWWLLGCLVRLFATLGFFAKWNPRPPAPMSGIVRKTAVISSVLFVSVVPSIVLPHHVLVAAALLVQFWKCVTSRLMLWGHPKSFHAKRVNAYREMNLALISYSMLLSGPGLLAWLKDVTSGYIPAQGWTSNLIDSSSAVILLCFVMLGQDQVPRLGEWTFRLILTIAVLIILFGVQMPYAVLNLESGARLLLLFSSLMS
ncbi:hypothetical protein SmJEL517_g06111 [Synchytrium microbalum]|uniref:GPI inositol-deacylase n=1 Tax=Synchytrium microbalum TaxID=1806994 RepID=A0A507BRB9_9FUNG|nr:uncharacterized protein SmJEL517_g06111 [Synchytrium microbalum]TPX30302.1 hypothetical protein SmJEL517_g06111 [Synchytrium microbalum]